MRCPYCGSRDIVRINTDWHTKRVTWKCLNTNCNRTWEMYNGEDNEKSGGFY